MDHIYSHNVFQIWKSFFDTLTFFGNKDKKEQNVLQNLAIYDLNPVACNKTDRKKVLISVSV